MIFKSRTLFFLLWQLSLFKGLFADGNDTLLVFEQKGLAEWQVVSENKTSISNVSTWSPLAEGKFLPSSIRVRVGEASWVRIWLRPYGKLSLGEKSVTEIRYLPDTTKLHYQVRLLEGRMGLEAVRFDETAFYEVFASELQLRMAQGHFLLSFFRETGLAEMIQMEGECLVSPRLMEGKRSKTDVLTFQELTLKKNQRVAFRDFRHSLRDFKEPGSEWAFAFQPVKNRKSDMMDLKRKWE